MVRDNNIQIRIFKNRLLYVLVCVLSGRDSDPFACYFGRSADKRMETVGMVIHYRGNSQCI